MCWWPSTCAGGGAPAGLEEIQLRLNDRLCLLPVQLSCEGALHELRQAATVASRYGKRAGPVQVQAHIDVGRKRFEPPGMLWPIGRQAHGAGGADAALFGQLCDGR